MACSLQYGKHDKLYCKLPEGGSKKDFKLFLCPDGGTQRKIATCRWSDSYQCDTEEGFRIEFLKDNRALITLLDNTTGSIRCQIAGQKVTSLEECSWEVRGIHTVDNTQGGPNTTLKPLEPLLPKSEDSGNGDTDLEIIIGCVVGAVFIVAILLLSIHLFRKYKHKLSPCCPEKANKNESPVSGSETVKIFVVGHENKSMVDNEQISRKSITRKKMNVGGIESEKEPFLGNDYESNEKNSCKTGSEKNSSDNESDDTKNDEGFEEKGSDEEKSGDCDTEETNIDEGFE